jgi:cold-inducible RNA-binding protein
MNEVENTNGHKIFLGNLPFSTTSKDLQKLCSPFGEVIGVNLREDRATGRPRGFGFVTFSEELSAQRAISALHAQEFESRVLTVNFATIRGSSQTESAEDNSWKTAPPPRKQGSKQQNDSSTAKRDSAKKQKSWTSWAGPSAIAKK